MGSRQVRLRSLQHRSGDDDLCNVVVPWVGQVGPQVLKGTSSGVGDGLDAEAQEGDKCKTSYSPHDSTQMSASSKTQKRPLFMENAIHYIPICPSQY